MFYFLSPLRSKLIRQSNNAGDKNSLGMQTSMVIAVVYKTDSTQNQITGARADFNTNRPCCQTNSQTLSTSYPHISIIEYNSEVATTYV